MNDKLDIWKIIKQRLKQQNQSVKWLAGQVGNDPSNLRRQLAGNRVKTELLLKISAIMDTDFFTPYSQQLEMKKSVKKNLTVNSSKKTE